MLRDKSLSAHERVVALIIAEHVNAQTGLAHPSIQTIAAVAGFSKRCVDAALPKILAHIEITPGSRGRGLSNEYRLKGAQGSLFEGIESGAEKGHFTHIKGASHAKEKGHGVPSNQLKDNLLRNQGVCVPPGLRKLVEIWGGRITDELVAAYQAAMLEIPDTELLAAAPKWINAPGGRPKYPRDLATWILERRYREQPQPQSTAPNPGRSRSPSHTGAASAFAGAERFMRKRAAE